MMVMVMMMKTMLRGIVLDRSRVADETLIFQTFLTCNTYFAKRVGWPHKAGGGGRLAAVRVREW